MKDWNLFIWLTQLGLSTAAPLAGFILLGVWLHKNLQWGVWTVIVGVVLGIICAVDGLRTSLRAMERMGSQKEEEPAPVSFNDHE